MEFNLDKLIHLAPGTEEALVCGPDGCTPVTPAPAEPDEPDTDD